MKLKYEKCMSSNVFREPFAKINDRYMRSRFKHKKNRKYFDT